MAASRWLFTKQQILNTPSRKHGIDQDKELSYRQQAANLIQDMGQRLVVTQLCINTAIVYMHRFYMFQSFKRFPRNDLAPACLFLAAKVEEQPRKLEHVIRVTHTCLHRDNTPPPDPKSEYYLESAHLLVVNENILLQTLGFDVSVDHPHTIVVKTTELVKASKDLAQTSYFLATNSLHLTTLCLQYRPATVACICIHLACKWSNWKIPLSSEGKEWHYYVDRTVSVDLLEEINLEFLDIMEKCPHKLRKKIMGWKAGNREALYEGDGRQSPMSAMRRLTPDSSSTDLRKPSQPPSHDPNRPGQSSSQHRSTNHDRKDGPQDQRSANPSQSDYRAGPDKKHVQSERKDEHLPERKEGLFERKDFLADKRLGHSQSHQERDANRHDRKEVPPDRKDRHPDRSDGNQHRKESYDRRDAQVRDQERKDLERKPDRKDYPVKKEVDEGRFHGNESRSQGREDRNLFQMVASDKLGGSQPASTATDLPRKAASDTALLPGYNSQHTPTSASSLSIKPKQEQTPLNYRDYLQRKERERKEKEKLMQSQADSNLNKTFTEGAKATERGDRSKHRPPNLNMSLPEDIVMGKSPGSQTSVIQRNRSFSGDRNQNNSVRQHNIVIKSPVKPHHNITVKSPIASSELRNFHIDVQKLTIPLTPDKPGSDPFTVNVKQHAAGQELMRNIKQEPGVTANIKQHSADHDLVKNIKQEPGISVNSKPASAGLELIKKIKQEPGISHSQPEKLDSVKVKIKSEPTTGLPETSNPVRTKSKSESTSSLPEKVDPVRSKSKLELVHSQPERTDTIKDKIEPTVAHSQLEKIDPVKIKIRSEQTDGAVESPTKPDTLDSASLAHLQKMKLKLKEELEMANSPKKTPKVPVLPEKDVAHVPVKRPSEAILDKTVSHIPPERTHKHSKHAPQTHSDRKKIPDIAVQKKIPEKVFPNMPNISVKTNQSFPKVRKIRTEPVLHTIPDEIPTKLKVETGLPIEDILKHKLKSDPGLPTMHNKPPSKMDDPSKQKAHVEPGTSRDNADRAGKHVVKHVANPDSNGSVIQLKPEHTGSEPLKLKIPELNVDAEKSPSLKFSIKTEPDTGSGGNTPIKVFLKRNTSQSGEKSPLKVKLSATGSKPDGEKIYEHGESSRPGSSHSHGKHKEKRKHKHRERHKEKHREHREKHHHSHATSELNGDKPGIKLSIKIPPQSSSSSELVPQRHSSKHEKHKRTSISDTALIKNQNSLEPERHQPWSANELAKRPRENSPARKRRRTPTVDQTSDASLQPSQNKAPKTETKGQRLRRSSSSHSVVSMEISDNETGSLAGCDILVPPNKADPQTEKKMEQIKLQLQQAIEQQSKKIQQVLQKQKSGFDLDSYMNASTSRPSLPSNLPPLPPTPPSSQTSIASPPPHPH